jgi:hypothetical protein
MTFKPRDVKEEEVGFAPRPPDYELSVMDKRTNSKGRVGAAWRNKDGSITIKVCPFVVLDFKNPELVVMLYPTKRREETDADQ